MVSSQHIDAKYAFEVVITRVLKPAHLRYSSTIDQDVHLGELQNLLKYCPGLLSVNEIAHVRGCVAAESYDLFRSLLSRFTVQVDNADTSSVLGKALRNGFANTAGPARH